MENNAEKQHGNEKQLILQLIVFRVSDEEFGIPIDAVQEIIKVGLITPIPDSPKFIRGLINVRGDIIAVIDVKARFCLPLENNEEHPKHIVLTKQENTLYGLIVEEVMEVLRIQYSDIKDPPKLMSKMHEEYIQGVIPHDGRLIILLDIERMLSEEELVRLAEVAHDDSQQHEPTDADKQEKEDVTTKKTAFNRQTGRSNKPNKKESF